MFLFSYKIGFDEQNWFKLPSSFPTDCSKAVPLWQFFVCALMVSYVAFVLSSFVRRVSFFLCFGKVVLRDCGMS